MPPLVHSVLARSRRNARDTESVAVSTCAMTGISIGTDPFTLAYLKLCSILNGMRNMPACALPSSACKRGIQNRPSCRPYSTVTAFTWALSGEIIPFTQPGGASSGSFSRSASSSAIAQMSIGSARRNTARTRRALDTSNHSEPRATFHFGARGLTTSSRISIFLPPGSWKETTSPLAYV